MGSGNLSIPDGNPNPMIKPSLPSIAQIRCNCNGYQYVSHQSFVIVKISKYIGMALSVELS